MKKIANFLIASFAMIYSINVNAQCTNFITENFDSFEYTTTCPYIVPGTTYQSNPQLSPGYGPSHSGSRHLYLNFVDGFTGIAFNRPYTVCVGATYRLSFYHADAWGGTNNTTFNIYDANNVLVHSQNVIYTGSTWNHWVSPELTATTTTLRLEIVNNIAYQGNNDMSIDDMTLEICSINETRSLLACDIQATTNLFDLFSNQMPTTGTWTGPATLGNGHLGTYSNTLPAGVYTYTTGAPGSCGMPQGSVTVHSNNPVNLGPDITICSPQPKTFNAGTGYDNYLWSNGATTQSITVSAPGTYSVIAKKLGDNMVQHGNFQGGTTNVANGFTTSYTPGTGGAWGTLSNPGTYAISTNPNATHTNFSTCGDHTTGTGNMLIANGSALPNTTVWTQTININQNQDYLFSFWAMNVVNDPNVSSLQLFINGAPIGPVNQTTTNSCNWTQIADTWNSGTATQAVLSIVNQSSAGGGNDFAIDDIIFTTFCNYYDTVKIINGATSHTTTLTHLTCFGNQSGSILINNPNAVKYSFDNGATWVTNPLKTNLAAGTYAVVSENQHGCRATTVVTLTQPNPLQLTTSVDSTICENGTATMVATSTGLAPISYHWEHTTDLSSSQSVQPTTQTTYQVHAVDANGCLSDTQDIVISILPPLSGTISNQVDVCPGYPGTISVNTLAGGLGAPYSILWSDGQTAIGTSSQVQVTPQQTQTYTATITDGCESTPLQLTVTVNVLPLPTPTITATDATLCELAQFDLVCTTDASLIQSVSWFISDGQSFINQPSIHTADMPAGSYHVQVITISPQGCIDSATFINYLTVHPSPIADFLWNPNPVMQFSTVVTMINSSVHGHLYDWYFHGATGNTYSAEEEPTVTFPEGVTGKYPITLIVTSVHGCVDTITKILDVQPEVILFVPNTFTPDGDEFNQKWEINVDGIDINEFSVKVFNRWGEIVWESNDPAIGWDGTYNGQIVQFGTYTWLIYAKDRLNDNKYTWNGTLNVIR